MRNRFSVPSFQTCLRIGTLVLAAVTPAALFSQAISFGSSLLIDYPNSATYVPIEVVPGDLNGDGNTDLVVLTQTVLNVTPSANQLFLLLGDGTGKFTSKALPMIPHKGAKVLIADMNGDGHQDILYLFGGVAGDTSPLHDGDLQVWLGDGAGNFHQTGGGPLGVGDVSAELGDFNNDGKQDVLVMISNNPNSSNVLTHETVVDVFLSRGDGILAAIYSSRDAANYEYLGPVGDYNRDGKSDFIILSEDRAHFRAVSGLGDGRFVDSKKPTYTLDTEYIISMSAADLNGDRKTDLVISLLPISNPKIPPKIATLLAKQTTGFYWYHDVLPAAHWAETTLVDLNGDGRPDIVYLDQDSGYLRALEGEANSLFANEQTIDYVWVGHFVAAPLKRGGLPDLFDYYTPNPSTGPGALRVHLNVSRPRM
jgi:FG-GAP-like repeat